jgi:hypothetical protein
VLAPRSRPAHAGCAAVFSKFLFSSQNLETNNGATCSRPFFKQIRPHESLFQSPLGIHWELSNMESINAEDFISEIITQLSQWSTETIWVEMILKLYPPLKEKTTGKKILSGIKLCFLYFMFCTNFYILHTFIYFTFIQNKH